MQERQSFNPPHLKPAQGVDMPDTHVKQARPKDLNPSKKVKARANRRMPNWCKRCTRNGNSFMCRCSICKKTKDIAWFYYEQKRGHGNYCIDCKQEKQEEHRKALKKTVATARNSRRAKTLVKEVKRASRQKTTKGETGIIALLDVAMYSAKLDKRAWRKKLEDEISEAQDRIAQCRVALSFLDKLK